ncbi:HTH domain-containing protein [Vagococcus sp. BWB3-3]|uniref:HTH domain-containing protein n=1 Tax=Vagococcus allomyrinae TaxID=2794353 RepID=A0A940PD35_9ENTE|nr:HTH domain-containing protein [Vagococcus allomyrinae]MBP1042595.1 HTH domain-containing protein [Vagococcus allomyrinae]
MDTLVKLVEILINHPQGISGHKLAEGLDISSRTVRNLVGNLESYGIIVNSSPKFGYRLAQETRSKAKQFVNEPLISERLKRQSDILMKLSQSAFVNYYEILDELFISEGTLDKELQNLRDFFELEQVSATIERQANQLSLIANEEAIREVLVKFLLYSNDYRNVRDSYQQHFATGELKRADDCLHKVIEAHQIYFTDYHYMSFLLSLMIQITRMQENKAIDSQPEFKISLYLAELEQSIAFGRELGEAFAITYSFDELVSISQLIIAYRSRFYLNRPLMESSVYRKNPYHQFTKKVIRLINEQFAIDFQNDSDFFLALRYEIEDTHIRQGLKYQRSYQSYDALQLKYPFVIDLACFIAGHYQKETQERIPSQGIIAITFLLVAALERIDYWRVLPKMNVAIFCSSGYANSQLIEAKVRNMYQNQVRDVRYFNAINLKEMADYQAKLLLTTDYLIVPFEIKTFRITNYFTFSDQKRIEQYFDEKRKLTIVQSVERFIIDQNIFDGLEVDSYQAALETLAQHHGVSDKITFVRELLERDQLFSTVLDNGIAIPRLEKRSGEARLLVATFKQPIYHQKKEIKWLLLPMMGADDDANRLLQLLFLTVFSLLDSRLKVRETFSGDASGLKEGLIKLLD